MKRCQACFWGNRPYVNYDSYCIYYEGHNDYHSTSCCNYCPDVRVGMHVRYLGKDYVVEGIKMDKVPILTISSLDGSIVDHILLDYVYLNTDDIVVKPYSGKTLAFDGERVLLNGKEVDRNLLVRDLDGYVMSGVLPRTRLLDALTREGFINKCEPGEFSLVYVNYMELYLSDILPVKYIRIITSSSIRDDVIIFNKWVKGVERNIKSGRIAFRRWSEYEDILVIAVNKGILNKYRRDDVVTFIKSLFAGCVRQK